MSSDSVITVENLSKRYFLGHEGPRESYSSLRDTLVRYGKNFARKTFDMARGRQIVHGDTVEEFWALKDLSFEVKRGEVLGIIGRNGAGKSTLLKVLSRITEPTKGRVILNGRVASLLEVGTGFHPELSGRENVFLNGAILGMTRAEIKTKFDEIVDFAGVEKFLDTPVKRYSSGMYVRLAFSVAAHLEPEILVIDEVLAVGDAEFQKKCLGKMRDVASVGRTVVFVSHQLGIVKDLCSKGLFLNNGTILSNGVMSEVLKTYVSHTDFRSRRVISHNKPMISQVYIDSEKIAKGVLEFHIDIHSPIVLSNPRVGLVVSTQEGVPIFGFNTDMDQNFSVRSIQNGRFKLYFKSLPLHPGSYRVSAFLNDGNRSLDVAQDISDFEYFSKKILPAGVSTQVVGPIAVEGIFAFDEIAP